MNQVYLCVPMYVHYGACESARVSNMYAIIRVRMYAVTIAQPFGVGKVEGRFGVSLWVMLPNQTPS